VIYPIVIEINKVRDPTTKGLNISKPLNTYLDNINLNGYRDFDGMNYTQNTNLSYLLAVHSVYGK